MKLSTEQLEKVKTAVKTLEDAGYNVSGVENITSYQLMEDEERTGDRKLDFKISVSHVEETDGQETLEI